MQDILKRYTARDHDGWLKNTILSEQGLIFAKQGRLSEALKKYRLRAQNSFPEPTEFLVSQLAITCTLDQIGNPEEAVDELEIGLEAARGPAVPTALGLLVRYAKIRERLRRRVPVRHAPLLQEIIRWYGLQISSELFDNSSSLAPAIIATDVALGEATARYDSHLKQLRDIPKDSTEKQRTAEVLQAYIDIEPVEFYRKIALYKLKEMSE